MDNIGADAVLKPSVSDEKRRQMIRGLCHALVGRAIMSGASPEKCRKPEGGTDHMPRVRVPKMFKDWPIRIVRQFVVCNGRVFNVWVYRADMMIPSKRRIKGAW